MSVRWWFPAAAMATLGVVCIVAGMLVGGPDAVGGFVFGGVLLLAAATSYSRRKP